jgi:hypothetical protein
VISALLIAATLLWNANAETNIGGYRVHYGYESRSYVTNVDVGNFTEWRLRGLSNGVTHHFAVTAYDTDGLESDFSDEVNYTPPLPCVEVQTSTNLSTWTTVATFQPTNAAQFYRVIVTRH